MDKVRRHAADRLPRPTTGGVVLERRGDGTRRDPRQTVPRIPRVATRAVAEQVAVEIGREDLTAKGDGPVGGIVARRGEGRRQRGSRPRAPDLHAVAGRIVRVGERAERGGVLAVRQPGDARRRVVCVLGHHAVRPGHARPPACRVVHDRHDVAALGDRQEWVRIVVGVRHGRLASYRHACPPASGVVGVAHRSLRRGLLNEPVQQVIGARDGACLRVRDLRERVACIPRVGDR